MNLHWLKSVILMALFLGVVSCSTQSADASLRKPAQTLGQRVEAAEVVFLGVLKNRVEKGDWVTADLYVETPLKNAKKHQVFKVTWRRSLSGRIIYDVKNEERGIAILKQKHRERYWLRNDKFENVDKFTEIQRIVEK